MRLRLTLFLTLFLMLAQLPKLAVAQAPATSQDHWVATWATAEQLIPNPPVPAPPPQSIGARGFSRQTVRMIVRISIGGRRLRVKLASAFGSEPVKVAAAHVALRAKDSEIVAGSDRALTFSGKPDCTLGPGVVLVSDAVDLTAAPLADLAISLYFPGETGPPTTHGTGLHTTYISKEGDFTAQPAIADPATTTASYYWLAGVDVMAPAKAAAIVAYGDSITDGAVSTLNTDHSWPALLAARLTANKKTANLGVANMGIGGNRVLRDVTGASALARFDRDVLSQSGVKWVIWLEGINDIGHGAVAPAEAVSAEELIAAYKQILERAHTHGIRVIGCTLTPYEGAFYSRPEGEAVREAVNAWIRAGGGFDAVVDFDAATHDPANPKRFRPEFDPGDHLHPNNAGYEAMAKAVDLAVFSSHR